MRSSTSRTPPERRLPRKSLRAVEEIKTDNLAVDAEQGASLDVCHNKLTSVQTKVHRLKQSPLQSNSW